MIMINLLEPKLLNPTGKNSTQKPKTQLLRCFQNLNNLFIKN